MTSEGDLDVPPGPFVLPWAPQTPPRGRGIAIVLGVAAAVAATAIGVWTFTGDDVTPEPVTSTAPTATTPTTPAPPTPSTEPPSAPESTVPTIPGGTVTYERWNGVVSTDPWATVAALPPDVSAVVDGMATPVGVADRSLSRLRAWITVPVDGDYRFWIAGDDQAWLQFAASGDPADARRIAEIEFPVSPDHYDEVPEQGSTPITLRAGNVYYVEAVGLEVVLSDHIEVAWSGPNFGRRRLSGPTVHATEDQARQALAAG